MNLIRDLITGSARNAVFKTTLLKVRFILFLDVNVLKSISCNTLKIRLSYELNSMRTIFKTEMLINQSRASLNGKILFGKSLII